MGYELSELADEIRKASTLLERGDARIDGIEASVNELFRKVGRPAYSGEREDGDERKDAIGLCLTKHMLDRPKDDGNAPDYTPGSGEIDEALRCKKAIVKLFRTGDLGHLDGAERKSLTSFSLGGSNFILPPQMSSRVLRCLVEPFNLASLVHNETISAGSIKFPIDNSRMNIAAWACEASCFANNPQIDLAEGLGELEIKAEPLRFVTCAGNDLLQDAAFNIEMWLMGRVARGFEQAISTAILIGNGNGMPLGLLHPIGGIPICETAAATPAGQFSWADLVALAFEVPTQWHDRAVFLMNQRVLGMCLTMTDAAGPAAALADAADRGGAAGWCPVLDRGFPGHRLQYHARRCARKHASPIRQLRADLHTGEQEGDDNDSGPFFGGRILHLVPVGGSRRRRNHMQQREPTFEDTVMDLPTDNATRLAFLVEGALAAGAREARVVVDAEGKPATLTDAGRVTLLRVIDDTRKGFDRIDAFLVGEDDDDDSEVRLASGDALFTLQERGAEPPVLEVHNRDVKGWLSTVFLALATKCAPDDREAAGHA